MSHLKLFEEKKVRSKWILSAPPIIRNFRITEKAKNYYNLDVIISVGYRVKSQ
jgi:hypothetical protein